MLLFLPLKLQNFISSAYVGDNVGKGHDYLCDLFFDCDKALTTLNSKMYIRFSCLFLWIMIFCLFISPKLHI